MESTISSNTELSIHFLTIVLNGQPYIPYHIEIFKNLSFPWHWHIVEGVAELNHDCAWSVKLGGKIDDTIHHHGLSHDGTAEYLDELAKSYPENVTIYRKPNGAFWDGRREMVNAPLVNIKEECLLWQIDVDELWTLEQLVTARQMFIDNPEKTAAFYWCWFFVGPQLIVTTRNCYSQNPTQEWLRTWRFIPGAFWDKHSPPVLITKSADGHNRDLATVNPFSHQETEKFNLVFQHFAYVTSAQVAFKEKVYGYKNAVTKWQKLQERTKFPILLRNYFSWVKDKTKVDLATVKGITPIAQIDPITNQWYFVALSDQSSKIPQNSTPAMSSSYNLLQTLGNIIKDASKSVFKKT
jgi:hypothetical protein